MTKVKKGKNDIEITLTHLGVTSIIKGITIKFV